MVEEEDDAPVGEEIDIQADRVTITKMAGLANRRANALVNAGKWKALRSINWLDRSLREWDHELERLEEINAEIKKAKYDRRADRLAYWERARGIQLHLLGICREDAEQASEEFDREFRAAFPSKQYQPA